MSYQSWDCLLAHVGTLWHWILLVCVLQLLKCPVWTDQSLESYYRYKFIFRAGGEAAKHFLSGNYIKNQKEKEIAFGLNKPAQKSGPARRPHNHHELSEKRSDMVENITLNSIHPEKIRRSESHSKPAIFPPIQPATVSFKVGQPASERNLSHQANLVVFIPSVLHWLDCIGRIPIRL